MNLKPPVYRGSAGALALRHLAENGPSTENDVRSAMSADSIAKDPASLSAKALRALQDKGLIATKVWLTPAGMEELERLGMVPRRAGVIPERSQAGASA